MKDFYVEVLSNASYITNTCSEFRNKIRLLHPLEGQWEVGLSEISYTKSWYNVPLNSTIGMAVAFDPYEPYYDIENYDYVAIDSHLGILKRGFYDNVETLVETINNEIKHYDNKEIVEFLPYLFYDKTATKQIYVVPGKNIKNQILIPWFDYDLKMLLGFEWYDVQHPKFNKQGVLLSQRPPDLTMGIRHLLVYCNLIMPQYVGDTTTKLLRSVEIPPHAQFGDQITLNYEKPHYIPILCNDFDEIEINISDDINQLIRFTFGRTRLKLHFKKIE